MFEHRVDDRQQLAQACHQGDLLSLARRTQALIERPNHGIESRGHDGCQRRKMSQATFLAESECNVALAGCVIVL